MSDVGIVFLDIDGVLVNRKSLPLGYKVTDDDCVRVLDLFMGRHPEARIVVSSLWRVTDTCEEIGEVMARHGFRFADRIIGATTTEVEFNGILYVSRPRLSGDP